GPCIQPPPKPRPLRPSLIPRPLPTPTSPSPSAPSPLSPSSPSGTGPSSRPNPSTPAPVAILTTAQATAARPCSTPARRLSPLPLTHQPLHRCRWVHRLHHVVVKPRLRRPSPVFFLPPASHGN